MDMDNNHSPYLDEEWLTSYYLDLEKRRYIAYLLAKYTGNNHIKELYHQMRLLDIDYREKLETILVEIEELTNEVTTS